MTLTISFPNINTMSPNKKMTPIICAFSKIFCGTGFPVMISHNVNKTWPPSNPGIGIKLRNANQTENIGKAPEKLPID